MRAAQCQPLASSLVNDCNQFLGVIQSQATALAGATDAQIQAAVAGKTPSPTCCGTVQKVLSNVSLTRDTRGLRIILLICALHPNPAHLMPCCKVTVPVHRILALLLIERRHFAVALYRAAAVTPRWPPSPRASAFSPVASSHVRTLPVSLTCLPHSDAKRCPCNDPCMAKLC